MTLFKTYTLCFIASCAFMISSCSSNNDDETETAFSMSDTMMKRCAFQKVKMETVRDEIRLFGKIAAPNNKVAQVFPIVGGEVVKINVELGDYVKQGEVLAVIQSTEVATFQKELIDAKSDVALAEKNLMVAKDMFEGKLNSEKDVIAAKLELDRAKSELSRMNEIYSIYKLNSGSTFNIVSPINGFVVEMQININEQIRSDKVEPVFSVAEIEEVWALAYVNESDISKIQPGYNVRVRTLAFPDTAFIGKIDKIFNVIDPITRAMKICVKIPNKDFKLKPEMSCKVSVEFSEHEKMIAVPSSSVIFDKSKYWVMVFKSQHDIETRKVEVYSQVGETTYIKKGLTEGETIISQNGLLIYDALND